MSDKHVLCLKWGKRYSVDYVNHLYGMVRRNLTIPHVFHCLTDDPTGIHPDINILPISKEALKFPGWWNKLSIFKEDFYGLSGDLLFIDLDMIIYNNIDDFFTYAPGKFCAVDNWIKKGRISSCIMRLPLGAYPEVWQAFESDPQAAMTQWQKEGDQGWILHIIQRKNMSFWPEGWVLNNKLNLKHRLLPIDFKIPNRWLSYISHKFKLYALEPQQGKVLAYNGKPDIHEIIENCSGKYRAAPWLKKYWYL